MGCECLRRIKNQMETLGLFCFVYRKTGFVFTLLYNNNRRKEKKNFLLFHIKSCFYPYACVCVNITLSRHPLPERNWHTPSFRCTDRPVSVYAAVCVLSECVYIYVSNKVQCAFAATCVHTRAGMAAANG